MVVRVFEHKNHNLITFLRDAKPFGNVTPVLYTVEFQERGMPLSICYFGLPKDQECAEMKMWTCTYLPSYQISGSIQLMMHGPRGLSNKTVMCICVIVVF